MFVAVIEVQLAIDPHKAYSWPAYAVGARTRHRCDVMLVVVTPYAHVAQWAHQPIRLGPQSGFLQPTVVGPKEMPPILQWDAAKQAPELAVLSAIAHGQDEDAARAASIASVAIAAAFSLPDHRAQVYYDLIRAALSDAAREALQMIPQNYEYQDEGLRRAKAEGLIEGKAEGGLQEIAVALIGVLEARGFVVDQPTRTRIAECKNIEVLRTWLLAAVTAPSLAAALGD